MVEALQHVCIAQVEAQLWVVWLGEELLGLTADAEAALALAQAETDGEGARRPIWLLGGRRSRDLAESLAGCALDGKGDARTSRLGG